MLKVKDCHLSIAGTPLVSELSFEIDNGQVLTLMGPSGCGKSSLLNYLSGTLETGFEAKGCIELNQKRIDTLCTQNRNVGILYQTPLLFPHMTNLENLLFAIDAKQQGLTSANKKKLAMSKLAELGLETKANNLPNSLSGGQQARIALLRTLLSSPDYLLLDEPFSKLDPELRQSVRRFTLEQIQKANIPTLLVTHDEDDFTAMGGELIQMQNLSNHF
ncbi:ABC transporter ATP-binding protein [Marinomonas sp. SBI22]|uniref:ATP-binding cassette domain-containing protein n=1 Tax=unclassified Marinomonas TaxID=196814 RepID=UPI0007AF591A|nr:MULTISPECIES: ATP-binding cassette domain-containing protein [unclassified Marinomonas]KZM45178.1 ABC transporter ATP-binding protein [Marinomonas sp. SBI22]KZM46876.1 ABC transporter ATP-binding protein [Marinomonas sp. SBI8L]